MKTLKLFCFLCVLMMGNLSLAQAQPGSKGPKVIINFNGEKTEGTNLNYNSSFIIENISMTDVEKDIIINKTKNSDKSYHDLQFISADNNTKLMVIVNVDAETLAGLSQKLRILFTELNVKTIEYNKIEMPVEKFLF